MSLTHTIHPGLQTAPAGGRVVPRALFAPLSLALAFVLVGGAAFVSWALSRILPYANPSQLETHMRFGLVAALLTVVVTILRNEHRIGFYAAGENTVRTTLQTWNIAVFVLFAAAFMTRRIDDLSRGMFVLFYVSGFVALWSARTLSTRALQLASKRKLIGAQRVLVVGTEPGIAGFLRRHQPWNLGLEVVGTVSVDQASLVGQDGNPPQELARVVELVRTLGINDIYVAVPWSETETIDLLVEAFLNTPVAIHLAPERVLDRFDQVAIARVGAMASLELTRPLPPAALLAKRAIDIGVSALALVVLAPILAFVALLIKIDSPGPVFFLQTRYGFNQRRFKIFKFRSMSTFADTDHVPQAERDDPRVTRLGRILRRTNIDELPQLLNVLVGHMSLVGPRPHAVPHNRDYERRIDLYARRHNVRPGITGWAQVNGLRGKTDTDEKMRRRVEYDLFYIDNWSMMLDLRIILRTVLSPRAYSEAY